MKKLLKLLKSNLRQKARFFDWLEQRNIVSNWFSLYLLSSSLLIQVVCILFKNWARKNSLKISYVDGFSLYVPFDKVTDLLALVKWNDYLPHFLEYTKKELALHEGDIMIDIGAHSGTFSIPLLKKFPKVRALAFEPEPRNYNILLKNKQENSLSDFQFTCFQKAVFNQEGNMTFETSGTSTVGSLSASGFYKNKGKFLIDVPVTTLEKIFTQENIKKCKLLKIDCEGSEYGILLNCPDTILQKIEYLIVEAHPTKEHSPSEIKKILEKKGFYVDGLDCQNGCWEYFCYRT